MHVWIDIAVAVGAVTFCGLLVVVFFRLRGGDGPGDPPG